MMILNRFRKSILVSSLSVAIALSAITPLRSYAGPELHEGRSGDVETEIDHRADSHIERENEARVHEEAFRGTGITESEYSWLRERYTGDFQKDNREALKRVVEFTARPEHAVAREILSDFYKLDHSAEGGLSIYPIELEQILTTWPPEHQEKLKASLKKAIEIKAGNESLAKQDALEQAMRENGILDYYRANKTVITMQILKGIQVSGEAETKLKSIAEANSVSPGSLEEIASKLFLKVDLGPGDWKAKSEEMSKLAHEIVNATSDLSDQDKRTLGYALGTAVIRTEQFQREDFARNTPFILTTQPNYPHKHFSEYAEWAKSYVEGTEPFKSSTPNGSALPGDDYRNIVAHDEWPVGMVPHDTRHIHYAVGHPKGVALVFEASRSRNPLRAALLPAMYEAVDTAQYSYEKALARYFHGKGMSIDQGLIFAAMADNAEMERIVQEAGATSINNGLLTNWKLPINDQYDGLGRSGIGFEGETDEMVRYLTELKKDPANASWMNYSRHVQSGQGGAQQDDESKQFSQ